jgi:thioredoxin 1
MVKQIKTAAEFDELIGTGATVFVDFFATWCGPCKMVAPIVEKLSEKYPDVTFVKVDVDEVGDLAQRLGIMSIPALYIFKDGKKAAETLGYQPEASFAKLIESVK